MTSFSASNQVWVNFALLRTNSAPSAGFMSTTCTAFSHVISSARELRVVIVTYTDGASGMKYLRSMYDVLSASNSIGAVEYHLEWPL